jgi:hypothetical protein
MSDSSLLKNVHDKAGNEERLPLRYFSQILSAEDE